MSYKNLKINMDEEPEEKKKINRLDLSNEESEGKGDGSIKNMKLDMETYESDFEIPKRKFTLDNEDPTLEGLDWTIVDEDGEIITDFSNLNEAPRELQLRWAEREVKEIIADFRDLSSYSKPNKKGRMFIPDYFEEDYSDEKNLKVEQTPEHTKLRTGTRLELRKELNELKGLANKLIKFKPYVGASTFSNMLFEFNKNIIPRIKWLESQLSLNISADYVDSEIKELGDQILEKYNLKEDLTEDMTAKEYGKRKLDVSDKKLKNTIERTEISKENVDIDVEVYDTLKKNEQEDDFQESEDKVYTIDGRSYIVKPNGECWAVDFGN